MDDPVELPNLAVLSTVALLADFILFQLSLSSEHSFNLSVQFCVCAFSCVDQHPSTQWQLSLVLLSLHGFVALCGASVLTDCIDRLTSTCQTFFVSGTYRSSLPTVDPTQCSCADPLCDRTHCTLQLLCHFLCHSVNFPCRCLNTMFQ